jgi:hypothetical protein
LFDKLWKHGSEMNYLFPGLVGLISGGNLDVEHASKGDARRYVRNSLRMPMQPFPPSVASIQSREATSPKDYLWIGKVGINVGDSAAYSGMAALPSVAKFFDAPPYHLRGKELRTVLVGSWLRNGRAFSDAAAKKVEDADYSDRDAISLVIGLSAKSSKITDNLVSMTEAVKDIDEHVAKMLIQDERDVETATDLKEKERREFVSVIRGDMSTMLESRKNARFLWPIMESSGGKTRDFAARKWAADTIWYAERRTGRGKKPTLDVLHDLFKPAIFNDKVASALEGILSPNSSSVIVSQTLTSLKAASRKMYCDVFSVLSSSKNVVIRGNATRALRDDCPASRF